MVNTLRIGGGPRTLERIPDVTSHRDKDPEETEKTKDDAAQGAAVITVCWARATSVRTPKPVPPLVR